MILRLGTALVAALLAGANAPAAFAAGSYGVYSGAGWSPVTYLPAPPRPAVRRSLGDLIGSYPPLGTAANPMPVRGPALLFEVRTGVLYNAPEPISRTFRLIEIGR